MLRAAQSDPLASLITGWYRIYLMAVQRPGSTVEPGAIENLEEIVEVSFINTGGTRLLAQGKDKY